MITYQKKYQAKALDTIIVSGHSLFAEYGNDIVCAAVSTAVIMTINAIETLGQKDRIKVKIESGYVKIKVLKTSEIVDGLLRNLIYSLEDIKSQYPNNLKEE